MRDRSSGRADPEQDAVGNGLSGRLKEDRPLVAVEALDAELEGLLALEAPAQLLRNRQLLRDARYAEEARAVGAQGGDRTSRGL